MLLAQQKSYYILQKGQNLKFLGVSLVFQIRPFLQVLQPSKAKRFFFLGHPVVENVTISRFEMSLRILTLSVPSLVIIGSFLLRKSSRKAHLSCCQMTTFFWCCIIYFTSSCLALVNISQSNHWVCFLDQQPQLSQPFYVILINYRLQRHLVDEFKLNFGLFRDNMILMNVVCGANFKVPREKIFP